MLQTGVWQVECVFAEVHGLRYVHAGRSGAACESIAKATKANAQISY